MAAKNSSVKNRPKKLSVCATETKQTSEVSYDKDFYKWIEMQVNLLKHKEFTKLDMDNLIEEIESLGRSDKRALKSYLIVLITHLLKQEYQPEANCNSSKQSILNSKQEINLILDDSPSLKNELDGMLDGAYKYARDQAASETGIDIKKFPKQSPWKIKEILFKC